MYPSGFLEEDFPTISTVFLFFSYVIHFLPLYGAKRISTPKKPLRLLSYPAGALTLIKGRLFPSCSILRIFAELAS